MHAAHRETLALGILPHDAPPAFAPTGLTSAIPEMHDLSGRRIVRESDMRLSKIAAHNDIDRHPRFRWFFGEIRKGSEAMQRVLRHVDGHIDKPICLADLARISGLNPSYINRQFKRMTGPSPISYLIERRLKRVRQCLTSGMNVTETAARCGFDDMHYFSALFKRRVGVTPSRYGKRHAAAKDAWKPSGESDDTCGSHGAHA